jgi:hypothetical protein
MRNESRNSKSASVPSFQIKKVLPLAGFSVVVSPWTMPSRHDHSLVSPSQPVRSMPLNSWTMPAGSEGAAGDGPSAAWAAAAR